jgi:hypothetical protein
MDAFMALADAQVAVRKLLSHPVRWQDPDDWTDRPVYVDGIPARIRSFNPARGEVLLVAEISEQFPVPPLAQEIGNGPTEQELTAVLVDILTDRIWWSRRLPALAPDRIGDESHE